MCLVRVVSQRLGTVEGFIGVLTRQFYIAKRGGRLLDYYVV